MAFCFSGFCAVERMPALQLSCAEIEDQSLAPLPCKFIITSRQMLGLRLNQVEDKRLDRPVSVADVGLQEFLLTAALPACEAEPVCHTLTKGIITHP